MSARLSFLAELQRRNVHRAAVFYAGAAWLLVQIATQVFPFFDIPNSTVRIVVIGALTGFPFALLFSWFYEWTPQGIVRESEIDRSESVTTQTGKKLDRAIIAVLALAVLLLLLNQFALHRFMGGTDAVSESLDDKSIAVLPLVDLSGDVKDSYLGDGISGELLTALSKLPGLKVIGRTSSFQFRGQDVDAAKVGAALHVRSLLAGTVQRSDDTLRVTVELVDTVSGQQRWSQHYDRSFKNLFALEDDISGAVSEALAVKLGASAGQPLVATATDNPHAHDLLLRANQMIQRSDEASLNQAAVLLNQAIFEDANYAEAWAALGRTYISLADAYRAPKELLPAMKGAAEKAVALSPDLAEAHAVLGEILLNYVRDYPAARHELERAIALDPGSASSHDSLATYQSEIEHDAAAARAEEQISEKLDPLNPWYAYWEMTNLITLGDFAEAENLARRVIALDPKFFYRGDPLVLVYLAGERWQSCVERARAVAAEGQSAPDFAAAICYQHTGDSAQAQAILKALEAAAQTGYADHSNIAAVRLALGDAEGAMADLEQADRDRSAPLLTVWALRWFAPLRDNPRFKALLERLHAGASSESGSVAGSST